MSRRWLVTAILSALLIAFAGLAATGGVAIADDSGDARATLTGYQEVMAVSTVARGSFRARFKNDQIDYELEYRGLESPVRQAHIHFGQSGVNGGISVFLCQTAANTDPKGLAPMCPVEGKVTGVIRAANVAGPATQGIADGEFAEFVRALRAGVTYANVHSNTFPGGEIRGQIRAGDARDGRGHDDDSDGGHGGH